MALIPIVSIPDPVLRVVATPVPEVSDGIRTLLDDMAETMYDAPGIGLAAPQISISQRLIVMDCGGEEDRQLYKMINPEIVDSAEDRTVLEEGCLSIPEQFAEVTRPKVVDVAWMDRDGNLQQETFDGLWATCVQHEIDHLDGKLFIDYLKPLKRQMITRKMVKLKREKAREQA